MSLLKIVNYGDEVLRTPAEEVTKVSAKIQKLATDMFDTMYAANGLGLAAPQVGIGKRIFVIDISTDEKPAPQLVFINPVIIKKEGAMVSWEGCLSFPNVFIDVKRYSQITVRAKDLKGKSFTMTPEPESLLCRAIQHEMDHLNGILFIDHVMDRFGTEGQLKEHGLPPIDPSKILTEPDLDNILQCSI